jgi:hypothetical protein
MFALYRLFVWDAAKNVARGAVLVTVIAVLLGRIGRSELPAFMVWMLAPMGAFFLFAQAMGRNLEWFLGLPLRRRTLFWLNFAVNASLVVLVGVGCGVSRVVIGAMTEAPSARREALVASIWPPVAAMLGLGALMVYRRQVRVPDTRKVALWSCIAATVVTAGLPLLARMFNRVPFLSVGVVVAVYLVWTIRTSATALAVSRRQRTDWTLIGALPAVLLFAAAAGYQAFHH